MSVALELGHDAHSRLRPLAVAAPARSNRRLCSADNPVRFIDAFVDTLDLKAAGICAVSREGDGAPAYAPGDLLKLYIYGYLNRIQSSRRLERETNRNIELMWLTGRLTPDFKTIADFRRDNGPAIRAACAQFRGAVPPVQLVHARRRGHRRK